MWWVSCRGRPRREGAGRPGPRAAPTARACGRCCTEAGPPLARPDQCLWALRRCFSATGTRSPVTREAETWVRRSLEGRAGGCTSQISALILLRNYGVSTALVFLTHSPVVEGGGSALGQGLCSGLYHVPLIPVDSFTAIAHAQTTQPNHTST